MAGEVHEQPEFVNAAEFTVKITLSVAGGARRVTADRRARRLAERLADAATRARNVVAVTADAGPSRGGEISWAQPIWFSLANSGQVDDHGRLNRYLDPDYERALRSLAAANTEARARREADFRRRIQVACHDPSQLGGDERSLCRCVYCRPDEHERDLRLVSRMGVNPFVSYRCLCGSPVAQPAGRCHLHRDTRLVLLHGDPAALQWLEAALDPVRPGDPPAAPASQGESRATTPSSSSPAAAESERKELQ